jgi:transposase
LVHVAVGQPTQGRQIPMNSVGIDIHKTRCNACVKTSEGRILEEFTFQNNSQGLEELVTHLRIHSEAQVAIESTGNLWTRIYDRLEQEQIRVVLTNPKKTRALTENKIKTDRIDARLLADLLRGNLLTASYVPPREIRIQRSIIRERARLVETRTILKNRIHTLLDKYDLHPPFTDLFGKHGLEWLRAVQLQPGDRVILDVNLEQLSSLTRSIDALTANIALSAVDNPEVKLLMGFTGIDYYGAMLLLNEIGPIARFPSAKKLVGYAGLAPSTHQSGPVTIHGHITKDGNSHIRWILIEAAQNASRHDPRLKQFYLRIAKRRGHQIALVAVARKMLVTIYHVLNHHTEYRSLRPELFENKIRRLQRITQPSLQTN